MSDKEEYEKLLESTQEDHDEYVATKQEIENVVKPIIESEYKTEKRGFEPVVFEEVETVAVPSYENKSEELECDFQQAREKIYNGLEVAQNSLLKLAQIADSSQHPRAYEVVALLTKTIVDSSKTLIDMHEKQSKITGGEKDEGKTINNNLFVGSTEELDRLIDKLKK